MFILQKIIFYSENILIEECTIIITIKMLKRTFLLLFHLLSLLLISIKSQTEPRTCYNPKKQAVDWWVIFLFPETSSKGTPLSYGYYDNFSTDMEIFQYEINTYPPLHFPRDSVLLKQSQGQLQDVNYFYWNDDLSTDAEIKSADSGRAHAKGGLIYDKEGGVFLSHSLPRFPRRSNESWIIDDMPPNSGIYGQSFICLTVDKENSLKLVNSLNVIFPFILSKNGNSDNVDGNNPSVLELLNNKHDKSQPNKLLSQVKTKGGNLFDVFSKGRDSTDLPYDTTIPEYYQDGLFVETWSKPFQLPSICENTFKTINIAELKFGQFSYKKTNEHSKWAVGMTTQVICIGDLNRIESQKKRGGNVICFKNEKLANIIRNGITLTEICPDPSLKFLAGGN
jgi:deoxyribonuclease-2